LGREDMHKPATGILSDDLISALTPRFMPVLRRLENALAPRNDPLHALSHDQLMKMSLRYHLRDKAGWNTTLPIRERSPDHGILTFRNKNRHPLAGEWPISIRQVPSLSRAYRAARRHPVSVTSLSTVESYCAVVCKYK
jgi:hypothetical protein